MAGEGAHGREPREVGQSAGRERVGQLGLRAQCHAEVRLSHDKQTYNLQPTLSLVFLHQIHRKFALGREPPSSQNYREEGEMERERNTGPCSFLGEVVFLKWGDR